MSSKSKSSSSQSQSNLGVESTDVEVTTPGGGLAGTLQNLNRSKVNVEFSSQGFDQSGVVSIINAVNDVTAPVIEGAADEAKAIRSSLSDLTTKIGNIAQSATGTESEAGRLTRMLAFPVMVVIAIWMIFGRRK